MKIYYWESENTNGEFQAENDEEALKNWKSFFLVLYRENDNKTGLPFIVLREQFP